jgi:glycosidase
LFSTKSPAENSELIPAYVPDAQVAMEGMSPDWAKSLVIASLRIETATEAGTFDAATRLLDHYAEMGVNALWIAPIFDRKTDL